MSRERALAYIVTVILRAEELNAFDLALCAYCFLQRHCAVLNGDATGQWAFVRSHHVLEAAIEHAIEIGFLRAADRIRHLGNERIQSLIKTKSTGVL